MIVLPRAIRPAEEGCDKCKKQASRLLIVVLKTDDLPPNERGAIKLFCKQCLENMKSVAEEHDLD